MNNPVEIVFLIAVLAITIAIIVFIIKLIGLAFGFNGNSKEFSFFSVENWKHKNIIEFIYKGIFTCLFIGMGIYLLLIQYTDSVLDVFDIKSFAILNPVIMTSISLLLILCGIVFNRFFRGENKLELKDRPDRFSPGNSAGY